MGRLEQVDLTASSGEKAAYKKELKAKQYHLLNLQQKLFREKIGLIIGFEGWDAAGKGGAIKRLTERLDPRGYLVHPIAAPAPHELRYHYLQRFWRKMPQHGQIGIFDRTWYGRVLVERIEGYADRDEWKRAYEEIVNFEKLLSDEKYIVIKFWIHISKDEQLKRFEERQNDPFKKWKITEDDWRNRKKWDDYELAAEEMFEKTDHPHAKWHIIAGNDKKYARMDVLTKTIQEIETALERRGILLD